MPYYYELQVEFTDNEGNFVDDPDIIVGWSHGKREKNVHLSVDYNGSGFREKLFENKIDAVDEPDNEGYVPEKNSEFGYINKEGLRCQLAVVQDYEDPEGIDDSRDWYYVERLNYNKDTKTINCDLPKYVTNFINKLLSKKGAAQ